ncbi:MAG: NAD(P)H-dependent oxidoreductase [Prochloraceae cyanobacterium]|nr:NAD(P)H-dependent oxidoreductase [Prochloraceae cyanobacterium]
MTNIENPPNSVLEQLNWRYATKKFDPTKKIPDKVWEVLEQSLVLAPSSFGLQPWKFIVVRNPEIRSKLLEHSWGQTMVVDASHLVVLTVKKDINETDVDEYIKTIAEVRETTVEKLAGFSNQIKGFLKQPIDLNVWSTKQVYIALGQFMTSAAMLEIDTCPMEGFIPAKYDEILGLTETRYSSVVLCPAGYRADDDKYATLPKVRFSTEKVVDYID